MKLAWRSETSAPPKRVPLSPAWSIRAPAETSGDGILEDAARRLVAVGLVFLLDDPDAPHPADDGFGFLGRELEFGREDQGLVEVGVAIGEAEVVALADLDLISRVEDCGPADELADGSLAAAGVAPQRPADGAGDAGQHLEAAQPRPRECEIKAVSGTAAPASTMLSRTVTSEKKGLSR